ncbi:MAG: SUMF1/EgtB/PvdO family nonheme iron enzyme, partial [Candidatus Riflebacteria bacterium]|nr:SUMF1/EgtB/PvdO family nonheme iron enzyme [Candidatus Riflebacteria bacterium]
PGPTDSARRRGLAAAAALAHVRPQGATRLLRFAATLFDVPPGRDDDLWLRVLAVQLPGDLDRLPAEPGQPGAKPGVDRFLTGCRARLVVARGHHLAGRRDAAVRLARETAARYPDLMEPYALLLELGEPVPTMPRVVIAEADGAPMVFVPGGAFWMGAVDGDADAKDEEKPRHRVRVSPFFLDQYPVTVGRFRRFDAWIGRTGDHTRCPQRSDCRFVRPWPTHTSRDSDALGLFDTVVDQAQRRGSQLLGRDRFPEAGPDDVPMTGVSWCDAMAYAAWAGRQLPTEAQWERAARGDRQSIYPWGNEPPPGPADRAHKGNGPAPVTAHVNDRSPHGACALVGSVTQWCLDWFSETGYAHEPPDALDPEGPASGIERSRRGATWASDGRSFRCSYRTSGGASSARLRSWGFRCARRIRPLPAPGSPASVAGDGRAASPPSSPGR